MYYHVPISTLTNLVEVLENMAASPPYALLYSVYIVSCTDTQGSHRWRISFIILLRKQKNSICMLDTFLDKVQSLWKIL